MPKPFTESLTCASGRVCRSCRLLGKAGEDWRNKLRNEGFSIPETNFPCPRDKEWSTGGCKNCGND